MRANLILVSLLAGWSFQAFAQPSPQQTAPQPKLAQVQALRGEDPAVLARLEHSLLCAAAIQVTSMAAPSWAREPGVCNGSREASPAVDQPQAKVWCRVCGIAIGLEKALVQSLEATRHVRWRHLQFQEHVRSHEEHRVSKLPGALLCIVDDRGRGTLVDLLVEILDETPGSLARNRHRNRCILGLQLHRLRCQLRADHCSFGLNISLFLLPRQRSGTL
jgi:hypothetical protein